LKETDMKKVFRMPLLTVLVLSFAGSTWSQTSWPEGNVRLVVPYAPGGTTDFAARQIAQKLTEQTGKSFFVENKAGASGTIGTDMVAKSKPDGATFQVNDTTYAMLPHLFKKLPWDHATDLIPVTTLAVTPLVVVVGANAPYKTAQEFIEFARRHPGKANYGSGGVGSSTHLGAELLKQSGKLFITHIPYKGAGDAIRGVMAGEVDILVTAAPTAIPAVTGGRVRALMVTSPKRLPSLPDVPTTAEVGLKDFNASNWFGLAAPKGTPQPVIDKMQTEVKKALSAPDLLKRFADQGAEAGGIPAVDFQKMIRSETQRWGQLIKTAGVQPE
jgi:tripartite-type tricarboxylate transporter receptor subunit TctC